VQHVEAVHERNWVSNGACAADRVKVASGTLKGNRQQFPVE